MILGNAALSDFVFLHVRVNNRFDVLVIMLLLMNVISERNGWEPISRFASAILIYNVVFSLHLSLADQICYRYLTWLKLYTAQYFI